MTSQPTERYTPAVGAMVRTLQARPGVPAGAIGRVVKAEVGGLLVTVEFADGLRKVYAARYLARVSPA